MVGDSFYSAYTLQKQKESIKKLGHEEMKATDATLLTFLRPQRLRDSLFFAIVLHAVQNTRK